MVKLSKTPSPREIREMCDNIRMGWTENEYRSVRHHALYQFTVPLVEIGVICHTRNFHHLAVLGRIDRPTCIATDWGTYHINSNNYANHVLMFLC